MTHRALLSLLFVVLAVAPLASTAAAAPTGATASIVDAVGRPLGTATFSTLASGALQVKVQVAGFDPGPGGDHGLHVHTVGKCEAPGFTSAGGHYNPAAKMHGLASPVGPHAGDLPNIQFYPDGSASYGTTTTAVSLGALLDADGSAIVIHASPDDGTTDPSGNSGARIGCGIIVADAAVGALAGSGAPVSARVETPAAPKAAAATVSATAPSGATESIVDAM